MNISILDSPLILSLAFHPRKVEKGYSSIPPTFFQDGVFEIDQDTKIGYRLYKLAQSSSNIPCFLYFHGNAEVSSDADYFFHQKVLHNLQVNMISIDFRGYGWSEGSTPTFSSFLHDAELLFPQVIETLRSNNIDTTYLITWGRSIGSAYAVHLAYKYNSQIQGLMIESGLSSLVDLPMVQQISQMLPGGSAMLSNIPDVFEQRKKLRAINVPVLILHGEDDEIIPLSQANNLFDASMSSQKQIQIFPDCGHNNLRLCHPSDWITKIDGFLNTLLGRQSLLTPEILEKQYGLRKKKSVRDGKSKKSAIHFILSQAEELLMSQQFEKATPLFTQAARENINDEKDITQRVCYGRLQCYVGLNRWNDAFDDSSTLLSLDPSNVTALTVHMKCAARLGRFKDVSQNFTELFNLLRKTEDLRSDRELKFWIYLNLTL